MNKADFKNDITLGVNNAFNDELLKRPKNLFELEGAIKKYAVLVERKNKYDRQSDEERSIFAYISRGIDITNFSLKNDTVITISDYLSNFGYSEEFVQQRLANLSLFTSDIEFLYQGKLVSFGNKIGIDFNYLKFDKNGNFDGVKEEYDNFLKYAMAHEFFHKLSIFNNNKLTYMTDDGLSEGFAEMFAHLSTGNTTDKSNVYDFSEKVCILFSKMLGMDKTIEDYIHHLDTCPNLVSMFQKCGFSVNEFENFRENLNSVIKISMEDKKQGRFIEEHAVDEKSRCLEFLQNNLIGAYCAEYPNNQEQVITSFNELFGDYGVKVESANENINNKNK